MVSDTGVFVGVLVDGPGVLVGVLLGGTGVLVGVLLSGTGVEVGGIFAGLGVFVLVEVGIKIMVAVGLIVGLGVSNAGTVTWIVADAEAVAVSVVACVGMPGIGVLVGARVTVGIS